MQQFVAYTRELGPMVLFSIFTPGKRILPCRLSKNSRKRYSPVTKSTAKKPSGF